jgi:cell division protein FtsQ
MRRLEPSIGKIAPRMTGNRGHPVTARPAPPLRKRPRSALQRWTLRFGFAFGGCAAIGGLLLWGVQSGWLPDRAAWAGDTALGLSAEAGLSLQTIEVRGRGETRQADILGAINAARGAPLLSLDIDAMRERLTALPWIVAAEIERHYPDRLLVTVKEAEPLALWQRNKQLFLVSRAGKVIETADLGKYSDLLVIVGDKAPERAEALFDLLAQQPELRSRVTAAVFVGKRRWNLRFGKDLDVKLPEAAPEAAWQRLAQLQRQYGVLDRDVSVIDLRLPDQIVLRQAHPPAAEDGVAPTAGKPKDKAT